MFRNYIKIAFRNVWKNKVFSLINIIGLSVGLSAAFVIGILIYYDLTFDKFHADGDRVYRVVSDWTTPEGEVFNRGVAVPVGKYLQREMVGIESAALFFNTFFQKIENKESGKVFRNTDDIIFTDASYFEMFKYKWLSGEPNAILSNPKEVVLTASRAAKYFPNNTPEQVIGKVLVYNDSIPVKITGVVENFKERSDFIFQEFLSLKTAVNSHMKNTIITDSWNDTNSATQVFVKVSKDEDIAYIRAQLDNLAEDHTDENLSNLGLIRSFGLQPLSDVHFNANYGTFNNGAGPVNRKALASLALVALFLLLLGCTNFINLNTAQTARRSKEIGIRKTLGSSKKQLIVQFLSETFLLTLIAAVFSLFSSSWLFRAFSEFIPPEIGLNFYADPRIAISIIILLLLVTFLSGFYPAVVLSRFRPIKVLRSKVMKIGDKGSLRKYLTVFQFVIAQVFIVATLFVVKQLNFLISMDMGFKTEANAYVRAWHDDDLGSRINFAQALENIPEISTISLAKDPPASTNVNSTIATYIGDDKEINTDMHQLFGDLNYLKLYDIKLLAGRDRLNDTINELVINETYSKILGFGNPEEAIDKQLTFWENKTGTIVGVMEDFHQRSLHTDILPMALVGDTNRDFYAQFNTLHFALSQNGTAHLPNAIAKVERAWKSIYPEGDFEIHFIDDEIKQFYEQERKTSVLLKWATSLAILISCLGLLGLVIHTTERRTKEIGIRKVLGASLTQLNVLLCTEFLILVGIAFTIATPIAYWGTKNWLQGFAYKTNLSWWVFAISGVALLLISMVVISIRTIAAANKNPVKSLHTE